MKRTFYACSHYQDDYRHDGPDTTVNSTSPCEICGREMVAAHAAFDLAVKDDDSPAIIKLKTDAVQRLARVYVRMDVELWIAENVILEAHDAEGIFLLFVFLRKLVEQGFDLADFGYDSINDYEPCCQCKKFDWVMLCPDNDFLCADCIGHMKEHS